VEEVMKGWKNEGKEEKYPYLPTFHVAKNKNRGSSLICRKFIIATVEDRYNLISS
jgi:hypothetical protein